MTDSSRTRFAPLGVVLGVIGLLAAGGLLVVRRDLQDAYFQSSLAVAALGFALAMLLSPGSVQAWMGRRQARYGGNALVMVLAFTGIVGLVNYLAVKNPVQFDLTEGQVNTLAPETVETLEKLPAPVKVVGFYTDSALSQRQSAEQLLERYQRLAPDQFSYEFVDPNVDPVRAREYGLERDATLFMESGDQRNELSFASETEITGGLMRVIQPAKRVVYFLTGEGEADPEDTGDNGLSQAAGLLKRQNYEIQPLNLQITGTVPVDARVVVVAGPTLALGEAAVQTLGKYLAENQDVALIVLHDPAAQNAVPGQEPGPDRLADYLRTSWGVDLQANVVVDLERGAFTTSGQNALWPVYQDHPPSSLTANLAGQAVVFPMARSLTTTAGMEGVTFTPVIETSAGAWGETDLEGLAAQSQLAPDGQDQAGPLTLAVTAEDSARRVRLVVFGDSDFARNSFAQSTGNADLLVASVNWATQDETLLNLTPKVPTTRTLMLTDALTVNLIFLVVVIVLPLSVLALGGVVWYQRRRHK